MYKQTKSAKKAGLTSNKAVAAKTSAQNLKAKLNPGKLIQRAKLSPGAITGNDAKTLQRMVGNGAVCSLLKGADKDDGQKRENITGMPDNLKAGVESLSGMDMSDIRVHKNSPKPATLQALAYTQGSDIYVSPGQERHLPHEAWHAVQQKEGRVQPTMHMDGVAVNDQSALENEASVMGKKAFNV